MLYYNNKKTNKKVLLFLGVRTMSTHSSTCEHLHDAQDFTPQDVVERLNAAKEQCRLNGSRFTALRQQIYQLILEANKPVGAYDLITQLQSMRTLDADSHNQTQEQSDNKKTSKNVAPPTVYRSLEFLLSEGLIHQLTSINAYVPCCHPRAQHTAAFLICDQCQRVQECSSLPVQEMMNFAEQDMSFVVERSVIELSGRCQVCQ